MVAAMRHIPRVCKVCRCKFNSHHISCFAPVTTQHCKPASDLVVIDRLSEMPDDILLLILSPLTMKEVARTSVVSKRWRHLWRHFPWLDFEDSEAMEVMGEKDGCIEEPSFEKEKSRFVTHVNNVLKEYRGLAISEVSIVFDLDISYTSHIDKWVSCALEKHVKRFELNFEPGGDIWKDSECLNDYWKFPERKHYTLSHTQSKNWASMTSLCLRNVDVSSETIQVFFQSCPLLVVLCVARSDILTRVTTIASGCSSVLLEHLEIAYCPKIETVDICAPHLLSLKYDGKPIKLNITNASLLSELHIGGYGRVPLAPAYDSLSEYFSNLNYLCLKMCLDHRFNLNLKPSHVPALTSVKHLRLHLYTTSNQTLLGWTSWINACPVLEKLTIQFYVIDDYLVEPCVICVGEPLRSLKTLELLGFRGRKFDVEIACYVVVNSINLQQVIVDFRPQSHMPSIKRALCRFKMLRSKIPKGIKLTLKKTYPNPYRR